MTKVSIKTLDGSHATTEGSECIEGEIHMHYLLIREQDPIHVRVYRCEPGARLSWNSGPTDLVAFVWKGAVDVAGIELGENSSIIVERGAETIATACDGGATLVSFCMVVNASAQRKGGHVHLLPSQLVPRVDAFARRNDTGGALYADAACPTCEVWLHENTLKVGNFEVALHSHSEDEVIFVTNGAIRLGTRLYGPGTAIAIAANTKYGFSAGPEGLTFVNFRGTAPTYRTADGSTVWSEADRWLNDVGGRPKYLEGARS